MNHIYTGILGLIKSSGQWTGPDLILARNKNEQDGSSKADIGRLISHTTFDCSKIDFLLKSPAKL